MMCSQTACRRKHLLTLATLVRRRVRQLMLAVTAGARQVELLLVRHHIAIAAERFAAHIAVVVLDAGVSDHVSCQIAGRDEGFRAHRTQMVADAGVDLFVSLWK